MMSFVLQMTSNCDLMCPRVGILRHMDGHYVGAVVSWLDSNPLGNRPHLEFSIFRFPIDLQDHGRRKLDYYSSADFAERIGS